MKPKLIPWLLLVGLQSMSPPPALAWGQLGHGLIGNAAVARLRADTRLRIAELLGVATDDPAALASAVDVACSWPDTVRETPQWAWSAPQHYVNIPRYTDSYDRQRDCPDGLCVTESISRYAAELSRPARGPDTHWQAFAWVCHLVGDVHQPLHAGLREDRGGNQMEIEYRGESYNLHEWWDDVVASEHMAWNPGQPVPSWLLPDPAALRPGPGWTPAEVIEWTEASHALALARAYPPGPVIEADFAEASWKLVQEQWRLAAERLARVFETVLAHPGS